MTRLILISPKLLDETIEALRTLGWIYAYDDQDILAIRRHREVQALIHQLERRRDRGKMAGVSVK